MDEYSVIRKKRNTIFPQLKIIGEKNPESDINYIFLLSQGRLVILVPGGPKNGTVQ